MMGDLLAGYAILILSPEKRTKSTSNEIRVETNIKLNGWYNRLILMITTCLTSILHVIPPPLPIKIQTPKNYLL